MRGSRRRKRPDSAGGGFTLIELLIAATIFALLALAAGPTWRTWIATQRSTNQAYFLAGAMNQARSEAIKSGQRVNLCKSRDRLTCADDAGGWETGWIMFVDENRDGQVSDGEAVVHVEGPSPAGVTVRGNRPVVNYVSYTSLGHARMLSGALQMGTLTVCQPGQTALQVVLANSGRARVQATRQGCP
ncbi:MAG TPA: GspH/FimT family pseudopilin [Casimicrobiaceae bacterium]|nr:GspH/FimT family pseudopilin [Casimicrobiaceae bacterium]